MSHKVGLQMEPFEILDIELSSSLLLAFEAQQRGYEIVHFRPEDVSFMDGKVTANVRSVKLERRKKDFYEYGEYQKINLEELDIILLRQDQPYNLKYVSNTYLLERLQDKGVLVVNNPNSVRKAADKWFVTKFDDIIPPTLISADKKEIKSFWKKHENVMLKPMFAPSGEGKLHLGPNSENLDSYLEMAERIYGQTLIAQKYVERVDNCDRRIVMIDGKAVGTYDRIAKHDESRATVYAGGIPTKAEMSNRDYEIAKKVGPTLKEMGIVLATIDVIGDYMIEINVNSPVGIPRLNQFDGLNVGALFWDAVEKKLA